MNNPELLLMDHNTLRFLQFFIKKDTHALHAIDQLGISLSTGYRILHDLIDAGFLAFQESVIIPNRKGRVKIFKATVTSIGILVDNEGVKLHCNWREGYHPKCP